MGTIRKTKSVKIILEIFEQTNDAISAVELVERLHQEMSKTTVYRILERLEEDGMLHSFIGNNGLKWYARIQDDGHPHHLNTHSHFQCRDCGKTTWMNIQLSIPSVPNYKIDAAELLMIGLCKDCKPK